MECLLRGHDFYGVRLRRGCFHPLADCVLWISSTLARYYGLLRVAFGGAGYAPPPGSFNYAGVEAAKNATLGIKCYAGHAGLSGIWLLVVHEQRPRSINHGYLCRHAISARGLSVG